MAGILLRRKERCEFHSYIKLLDYNPNDYEVLLQQCTEEPFVRQLSVLTIPSVWRQSPEVTAVEAYKQWSESLATMAGMQAARSLEGEQATKVNVPVLSCDYIFSLEGRRAVFLSVHGGGKEFDVTTGSSFQTGVTLCYIVPITQSGKSQR